MTTEYEIVNGEKYTIIDGIYYCDCDLLSNSVNDLLKANKFKKAKSVCKRLLKEYPWAVDGYMRYAQVYAAEGNKTKAIDYHLKELEFMILNPDGFEDGSLLSVIEKIERLNQGQGLFEIPDCGMVCSELKEGK